jgi:lysophospholipase L1-like esterase
VAAGIDPNDPDNQHVFQFTVNLSSGTTFSGYGATGGFPLCPTVDGVKATCDSSGASFVTDSYTISVRISWAHGQPQLVWLVIPGKASWLKEFFSVQMMVTNLADDSFVLDHGSATLPLPPGLSLAPTAVPQRATVTMPNIPGGQSATATWIVRGDAEGYYDLTSSYAGSLEPFGDTIAIGAASQKPLHVWGGSAVEMTVDADSDVYDRYPYHVRIGLTNKADVPIYNASVELLKPGKANYIYQPREALQQGTAAIAPGDTFWTDDYILAPDITGQLDLAQSFVEKTAGDVSPPSKIVQHPPLQTPESAPMLRVFWLHDAAGLLWDPVAGATSYEIYRTPNREMDFPNTPVAVLPHDATQAVFPTTDTSAWYAVSAIVNGRNTMVHPIARATGTASPQPTTSVALSTRASCGADVSATARFSDLFYNLRGYTATLDDVLLAEGTLSGRTATVPLKIAASKIRDGGSKLVVKATDSSGATGPDWREENLTKDCNPIRMLVVGDSIAWGQGLEGKNKYAQLVADEIESKTKRTVEYVPETSNLAHSGAVVNPDEGTDCRPDFRSEIPIFPGGEVPEGTPNIGRCQVAAAKTEPADLILVDGCINDVGIWTIFIKQWIDLGTEVDKWCRDNVVNMLQQLHTDHPSAVIVLTGYYPVFTAGSPDLRFVLASAWGVSAGQTGLLSPGLLELRAKQFYEKSTAALEADVKKLGGGSTAPEWLKFVNPGITGDDDGVGALQSKLWTFPGVPFIGDDVSLDRAGACSAAILIDPKLDRVFCESAPFGHPNRLGAAQYKTKIMEQLADQVAGWTGPPTVTRLTVNPSSLTLAKGDSATLQAEATFSDRTTGDAGGLVTWSSSSPAIVSVDRVSGVVTGLDVSNADVTVTADAGNGVTATAKVKVTPAVLRKVAVTPTNPVLALHKSLQFTATGTMSDGTTRQLSSQVQWSSSNPMISTISSTGSAKALGVGTTTISATTNSLTGSTVLTVLSGSPSISGFSPSSGPVGTTVVIKGANLLGTTSVTFGGVPATTFHVDADTQITVVVPARAKSGRIGVVTPLGKASSKDTFRVT